MQIRLLDNFPQQGSISACKSREIDSPVPVQLQPRSVFKTTKAAIYFRTSWVSVQDQAERARALRDLVTKSGWELYGVYPDKGRQLKDRHPGFNSLMADGRRGRFDVVLVSRLDCFARSSKQLVFTLEEFEKLGIRFISQQEGLDTGIQTSKAMLGIVASMAQMERTLHRERVIVGLNQTKNNGTKSGNPVGRPRKVLNRETVNSLRREGRSWREIGKAVGAGITTVRRLVKDAATEGTVASGVRR
jgi:putative DNA-invertase from lambdoid prophage Rac